eukprot:m.65592 g.65592  ORF g.65592 m.65592 type:complete len:235 (-) comp11530_c0_seq1:926-1630(-)
MARKQNRKKDSDSVDETGVDEIEQEDVDGEEIDDDVDPDTLIEGVPDVPTQLPRPKPASSRPFSTLKANSEEGKYYEENILPTLDLALNKLILAIKYNIPKDIRSQYQDPSMVRTNHPEHAIGFDPINWLATFLKRYNPNVPPKLSSEEAARIIQSGFRGARARSAYRKMTKAKRDKEEAEEIANRREKAALKIQSVFRGHSVRLAMETGTLSTPTLPNKQINNNITEAEQNSE